MLQKFTCFGFFFLESGYNVIMKILRNVLIGLFLVLAQVPAFSMSESEINSQKLEAIALYNANNLKEAYAVISSIPEEKRDAELWLLAANITEDYERSLDAVYLLQRALKSDPKYYKAYYNLGNINFKQKKYNTAISYYRAAVKYYREFPQGWYNLGCAYYELGEYDYAKKAFMRAITYDAKKKNYYYNLALTYKQLNKPKQVQKMLDIYNKFGEDS